MNSSLFCALSYPKFNTLAIGGFTLPISGGFTLRNFGGAKLLITPRRGKKREYGPAPAPRHSKECQKEEKYHKEEIISEKGKQRQH